MTQHSLSSLGWSADFLRQLAIDEIGVLPPARVSAVHRDRLDVLTETGSMSLHLPPGLTTGEVAVGDWVLVDPDRARVARVLDRKSLLHRRAAGVDARDQLIAANVDTLFIATSMNADFNPARLERYLALAYDGGVAPVFVLTKADLCDDPAPFHAALRQIAAAVPVVTLDARDGTTVLALADWCGPGQTVALLGSSGVGKSTLATTLTGAEIATQGIREDDAKGRHTTTSREFHPLAQGGWLIDTPGMRALRLAGVEAGIDAVFDDIAELAGQCRFSDCQHESEPGCAVQAAITTGALDPDRLGRWQKLRREDARNARSIAEAHAHDRAFGRMIKQVMKDKRR
ncbi:ribosome small subunit-dependent GTPase A [Sinisalibacter aestuarii]|uniref:Small ribosomal subunit biogenesis GTPase RsgA n=1 Tax=Sinisalibacter aestuarii TaxID=2949426 RepID=A0ABQ5LQT6_9RHOB|nr:ribosome small subunit-dependent GTPase A [Sinisalibacter aestuarii]GKY86973.1 putative ribosome biogenesis GTPase RsgA [Sinisalibacter aestuarii]